MEQAGYHVVLEPDPDGGYVAVVPAFPGCYSQGFPAASLAGYTRETVVAEKFHAMVYLRTANTRMKDFHDVWLLAKHFPVDGQILAKAVSATFAHRDTVIDVNPIAFTPEFTEQATTVAQWKAFRRDWQSKPYPNTCPRSSRCSLSS